MRDFLKHILFCLFFVLILVIILLSSNFKLKERFVVSATDSAVVVTGPQTLISPLVSTVNGIVDFINQTPIQVYTNTITMSKKIGSKVKEYAETMTTYNRTPDPGDPDMDHQNGDPTLQDVMINARHQSYIDHLHASDRTFFSLLSSSSATFYKMPFDQQDDALVSIVSDISNKNKNIQAPLQAKIQAMNSED